MKTVNKFGLIIIESLPDNERKTGYDLHSSIIKYKSFSEPNLCNEYYEIENKFSFFETFEKIVKCAEIENNFYLLHFEMHGHVDGLVLKNNEIIYWDEALKYFIKLNTHYKNSLIVHLAVCKGAHLIKHINPLGRSPFKALLSCIDTISEEEIIRGFEEYYTNFFFSFKPIESLKKLKEYLKVNKDEVDFVTSKYLFNSWCNQENDLVERNKLVLEYKQFFKLHFPEYNDLSEGLVNKYCNKKIDEHFEQLRNNRDYFFMEDIKN